MTSDFVEECRREWRRLRVPTVSAEEMADDLAADLREAEAEGAFPEEVLGDGAKDPRAFAAAWATERGLVRPRRFAGRRRPAVLLVLAALLVVVVLVVVVGLLAIAVGGSAAPRNSVTIVQPRQAGGVIGTEISSAFLTPGHVRLDTGRPTVVLERSPSSLTTTVRNSGTATVRAVTLVITVDGHRFTRTTGSLRPAGTRKVTLALPGGLPSRFILSVRSERVPGERNLSNNRASWRIRVRR